MVYRVAFSRGKEVIERDEFYLPEEIIEWIGLKKSEYLSKLLSSQSPNDIGFEEYLRYDKTIPETLENPDQSFESKSDGYVIRTYTKSYLEGEGFHQVVIGGLFPDKEKNSEVFVPILSFVTKFQETMKLFSEGDVLQRPTMN